MVEVTAAPPLTHSDGRRSILMVGVTVGLLVGAIYLTRVQTLPWVASLLDVSETPRRMDYVFVMMGDEESRPFVAAGLIRSGYADQAMCARLRQPPQWSTEVWPLPHTVIQRVLISQGIADERIHLLDGEAATTAEEIAVLGRFLQGHPQATVNIVTSDFHTRRTRWTVRRQLGAAADRVRFVAAPMNGVDPRTWWQYERGFVYYSAELLKLVFYWCRFAPAARWLGLLALGMLGTLAVRGARRRQLPVGGEPISCAP